MEATTEAVSRQDTSALILHGASPAGLLWAGWVISKGFSQIDLQELRCWMRRAGQLSCVLLQLSRIKLADYETSVRSALDSYWEKNTRQLDPIEA